MSPMLAAFLVIVLLEFLVLSVVMRRCPPSRKSQSHLRSSMELLRRAHEDKDRRKRRAGQEIYYQKLEEFV